MSYVLAFIIVFCCNLLFVGKANAYIGPGAGFAVISSFLTVLITGMIGFLAILAWPARAVFLYVKRRKYQKNRKIKRVIVLGLDGFDPFLTNQFMKEGLLPNFKRLSENGTFRPLKTTTPSISPVAWATFATGVNPGKHRIFDFYTRDPRNYMPVLSSARISSYTKIIKLGPIKIPLRKTNVQFLRKSVSFWKTLGESGIFSSIMRVPLTFPAEKLYGHSLSAMCTPDLRGTQGAFTFFTAKRDLFQKDTVIDGTYIGLRMNGNRFSAEIPGPILPIGKGPAKPLSLTMKGRVDPKRKEIYLNIGDESIMLVENEYSPWVKLDFKIGVYKHVSGIARFLCADISSKPDIYMTPINIDPEKPSMPVASPLSFCISIAKTNGRFATLGLAEDTWALNERLIDEGAFLNQAYDIFEERKSHFLDVLKKNKNGFIAIVFDTTDRIQHMFFRYLDAEHPANRGKDTEQYKTAIQELYVKMDALVGEVSEIIKKSDILMVISDHGFKQFKWGVNLNSWLWREGYLVLKEGADPNGTWFADVDWTKTRAYAYALAGIFLNLRGRESQGIVDLGEEREALQMELKTKLEAMKDERNGASPVLKVHLSQTAYKGPYVKDAPDLLIGYKPGYRASWNSAVGRITENIIEDNDKSWSGDHTLDADLASGVFFSNCKMKEEDPSLMDLAPTILHLYGLNKQKFHDGRILHLTLPGI